MALDLLYTDEILITVRLDLTFSLTLLGSSNLEERLLAGRGWGQGLELCEPAQTALSSVHECGFGVGPGGWERGHGLTLVNCSPLRQKQKPEQRVSPRLYAGVSR